MDASPACAPVDDASSFRGVLVPFAAVSAFLALIQVLCLGLSVAGVRIGQPVAILIVVAAAACAGWFAAHVRADIAGTLGDGGRVTSPTGPFERVIAGLVVVVLLWAAWVWIDLLRLAWYRPPYFWDSLVYHIPAINDWVQQGRVGFVRSVPDIPFVNYPMGVEVTAFLVHQMTGTSRLVDASNLWYWPLGVTALAVIAAEIGARGVWRWLAGALLFGAPTFVGQGATAYVDAGFSTTVMGSLAAACVFVSSRMVGRWWAPVLLGLNLGLMMGAKGSGLTFALVFVGVVSAVLVRRLGVGRLRLMAVRVLACGAIAVAVGGYWYLRNALETGNPIYPFRLQIGHLVLNEGFDRRFLDQNTVAELLGYPMWTWRFVAWLQPDAPIHGPYSAGGLGYLWVVGCLPSVFYMWFLVCRGRRHPALPALAPVTVLVALLLAVQPVGWQARFTLWVHGLGLPCVAAVLHDASKRWRSHRGHLLTIAFGMIVVAVATWESRRTLNLEWSTHRVVQANETTPEFRATSDVYFPGMADAAGFRDFFEAETVARGRWSRRQAAGTFLGGVLAMPLGRRILVFPALAEEELANPYGTGAVRATPRLEDIAHAQRAGAEWLLWESDAADDIPPCLAPFEERYRHRVADDVFFELVHVGERPGRQTGSPAASRAREGPP